MIMMIILWTLLAAEVSCPWKNALAAVCNLEIKIVASLGNCQVGDEEMV